MVKITIEEDNKVRTISGNFVAGFVTEKATDEQDSVDGNEINTNVFMVGGTSPREIISSLSVFCIEVVTAMSKASEMRPELGMEMFKDTISKMESGKATYEKREGDEE